MAYKDFFSDFDPLAEVRDTVPLIPTKAKPVQKQTVSVEDPFTDLSMQDRLMFRLKEIQNGNRYLRS